MLAMPEVRKKFDELGLEPVGNTPPNSLRSSGKKRPNGPR